MINTIPQPKVSVVMPAYNAEHYIHAAIESILKQSFTDFEFIIIDDGSTDRTADIIRRFDDPRIHYVKNDVNSGVTASLNRGLEMARGTYIARMDADDISLPQRLQTQVTYLDEHPETGVLGSNALFINESGQIINDGQPSHQGTLEAGYLRWVLTWNNPLIHPTVMIRKQALEASGLKYTEDLTAAEDYDLWRKLIKTTDITALETVLLHYRVLPTSINRTRLNDQLDVLRQVMNTDMNSLFGKAIATESAAETLKAIINRQTSTTQDYRAAADLLLRAAQHFLAETDSPSAKKRIKQDANLFFRRMAAAAAVQMPEDGLYVLAKHNSLIFGDDFASMGYDAAGQPDPQQPPIDLTHFQIVHEVPRFVEMESYADAFGKQWNVYRKTQLDSYTGVPLSKDRLEHAAGSMEIFRDKNVLEAGCGAGRFSEVMLEAGAHLFAIDLSNAVDANYENCKHHPDYFVCQADLFKIPVQPEQFDVVVCFGVLQATPNPEQALEALVKYLKPGGYLVIDIYPTTYRRRFTERYLRAYLLNKPPEYTIKLTRQIRDTLWPIHVFLWRNQNHPIIGGAVRRIRPTFKHYSPVADYHDSFLELGPELLKEWAALDMHDFLTDYYKHLRSVDDIKAALRSLNMIDVETKIGGNGVESLSRKPEQPDDPNFLMQQVLPSAIHPTLSFDEDPYPGRPKVLFIGHAESPHTRGTIDLLDSARFNVRLFALPNPFGLLPPVQWKKRTYITNQNMPPTVPGPDPMTRKQIYPSAPNHLPRLPEQVINRLRRSVEYRLGINQPLPPEAWLAKIIREWQPDIIETLGIQPSGEFYLRAREQYKLHGIGHWSLTIRGTPDYEMDRHHPSQGEMIRRIIQQADQILSDNEICLDDALDMGAKPEQIASIRVIPGSGGLHIDPALKLWQGRPSQRRAIVMPKAYESPISAVLPVFEALKLCWDQIQPAEIYLIGTVEPIANKAFWMLPEEIRNACHVFEQRIPHEDLLMLLTKARVMLAPSMLDGTPNVALEAMAMGAVPILSPLRTLTPLFKADTHVLYARNLYPEEIAEALTRAMTNDTLVDAIAQNNIPLVRDLAERSKFATDYAAYYEALARAKP